MFLSIGMLKQKYFLTDIFILSAEKQPIKLSWRKIEWLRKYEHTNSRGVLLIFGQLIIIPFSGPDDYRMPFIPSSSNFRSLFSADLLFTA